MTERKLTIDFEEYTSAAEMEPQDRALVERAIHALAGSYSPYSRFRVGAALLLENGTVVIGSNQENNSYPAGLCAERTAMFAAGANYPGVAFDTLAIVASHEGKILEDPATPCGICRQVMAEYQTKGGKPLKVILAGSRKIYKFSRVDDLLPLIFDSLKA